MIENKVLLTLLIDSDGITLNLHRTNNYYLSISISDEEYKIVTSTEGPFMGCIDWLIDDKNLLQNILIHPIDEYDDYFNKLYNSCLGNNKICYEEGGNFDIQIGTNNIHSEANSIYQTFDFSGLLYLGDEIKGFVFEITSQINSLENEFIEGTR